MTTKLSQAVLAVLVAPAVGSIALCLCFAAIVVIFNAVYMPALSTAELTTQLWGSMIGVLIVGLGAAYTIALPIALAAYGMFRRMGWNEAWQYAAGGGVIGVAVSVVPLLLLGGASSIAGLMVTYGPAGAVAGGCAAATFWWIAVRQKGGGWS